MSLAYRSKAVGFKPYAVEADLGRLKRIRIS
uniref:Uncharacterized protein n=1 Tax=Myoviridae sp. ctJ2i1 TaxID=2825079 RepID=A0A8S5V1N7_9CAUD|nr:MAG TPA: hypothetical protein [Myoviridae sp. ctJ2i1]